ncbi:hypothetical protein BDZ45DRAFT_752633 [Acephala macrosclerotiorum]|nr:hypothetical protein BDZ45DRAFT_752633 [Acephala macrosclerotiorum]
MDKSMSSSQLEDEIAALTLTVAQLENEIYPVPYPLCKPEIRVITLEPFRKVQNSFLNWNENKPFLLEEGSRKVKKTRSNSMIEYDGDKNKQTSNTESNEHNMFRKIEDESCLLIRSGGSILEESEDIISPAERAKMRVLAVLRSYLYNLENGTLVTGDKVDAGIVAALRDLLDWARSHIGSGSETEMGNIHGEDNLEVFEKSDEEGVIDELSRYKREMMGKGRTLDKSVVEASRTILDWKRA